MTPPGGRGTAAAPLTQVNSGHWLWAGWWPEPGRDERVCQGGGGVGGWLPEGTPSPSSGVLLLAPRPGDLSDACSCSQRPRVSSPGQPCAPWRGAWGAAPRGRPFLPTPHPRSPAHCRRLPAVLQLLARADSGQWAAGLAVACSCEDGVSVPSCVAMPPGQAPSPQVSALMAPAETAPECVDPWPQDTACGHPAPPEEGRQLREWGQLGWGLAPKGLRAALRTCGRAQDLPRLPVTWCSGSGREN